MIPSAVHTATGITRLDPEQWVATELRSITILVPDDDVDHVVQAAGDEGKKAFRMGRVVADPESRVVIERDGLCLVSEGESFAEKDAPPAEHRA